MKLTDEQVVGIEKAIKVFEKEIKKHTGNGIDLQHDNSNQIVIYLGVFEKDADNDLVDHYNSLEDVEGKEEDSESEE